MNRAHLRWIFIIILAAALLGLWLGRRGQVDPTSPTIADSKEVPGKVTPFAAPPHAPSSSPPLPAPPPETKDALSIPAASVESFEVLSKLTATELWNRWLAGVAAPQGRNPLLGPALAAKMRENTPESAALLDRAFAYLTEAGKPELQQITLAKSLAESGNPEAFQILLESLERHPASRYENDVLEAISEMGGHHYPGRDPYQMHEFGAEYWQKFLNKDGATQRHFVALAKVLAESGTPESVEFLLTQAETAGGTPHPTQGTPAPGIAALVAARLVRNPAVVPLLSQHLVSNDLGSQSFIWAGEALASMGNSEATKALLEWSFTAPASSADLAEKWLSMVRDTESGKLLREAAANAGSIQTPSVRASVIAAAQRLSF